ncbi:hypothetical protein J2S74_002846 [Evansella vedderi]|uniref:Uncharacterized protein n=1 Tax=Evansella vedderi TaxID=38282 RepID=A0ABT9ZW58_9BACI|nr:hypothetical protein [Evansella vedderi]
MKNQLISLGVYITIHYSFFIYELLMTNFWIPVSIGVFLIPNFWPIIFTIWWSLDWIVARIRKDQTISFKIRIVTFSIAISISFLALSQIFSTYG